MADENALTPLRVRLAADIANRMSVNSEEAQKVLESIDFSGIGQDMALAKRLWDSEPFRAFVINRYGEFNPTTFQDALTDQSRKASTLEHIKVSIDPSKLETAILERISVPS